MSRAGLRQSATLFQLTSPPLPTNHFALLPFPSISLPLLPQLKTARGFRECCKLPSGVRGGKAGAAITFCCIVCSQNSSDPGINICVSAVVVQIGKTIYTEFFWSKIPPPKVCGPVQPNTLNMPRAGPEHEYHIKRNVWNVTKFCMKLNNIKS